MNGPNTMITPRVFLAMALVVAVPGVAISGQSPDAFEQYLQADIQPADGFDFPVGNPDGKGSYVNAKTGEKHRGWYVATTFGESFSLGIHPGEDWNGRGGGNTDLDQPVHSVAAGKVAFAGDCGSLWGKVVMIDHLYYENHEKKTIRSLYAHLGSILVKKDEKVTRRQKIGTIGQDPEKKYYAHLHLELRRDTSLPPTYWPSSHEKNNVWIENHYASPSEFLQSHRSLFVPQQESTLVLVHQAGYRMQLFENGKKTGEYRVGFGQSKGQKRRRGDNRTPKGMYFVVDRHRGEFSGDFGAYYGGHWIKINYPNQYDAAWGKQQGILNATRERQIKDSWRRRELTWGKSRLGGGIGFHGWIQEWPDDGPRHLSWGCIVMHNRDIKAVYDRIPKGSMVVIF